MLPNNCSQIIQTTNQPCPTRQRCDTRVLRHAAVSRSGHVSNTARREHVGIRWHDPLAYSVFGDPYPLKMDGSLGGLRAYANSCSAALRHVFVKLHICRYIVKAGAGSALQWVIGSRVTVQDWIDTATTNIRQETPLTPAVLETCSI